MVGEGNQIVIDYTYDLKPPRSSFDFDDDDDDDDDNDGVVGFGFGGMEDPAFVRDALADNLFSVPGDNNDKDNRDWGERKRIQDRDEDGEMDGAAEHYASGRRQRTVAPSTVLAPDMDLEGLRRELATFDLEGLRCSLAKEGMDAAEFDAPLQLTAHRGG